MSPHYDTFQPAELLFDYISQYMSLTEAEKAVVIELNVFKFFRKGTVLLKIGEGSNQAYFVIKGCIRCFYMVDGEEKTTAFYTESESFTPLTVVNQQPSEYFVACVEDCVLLVTNTEMEKRLFERFPRFETLCRLMSEKLLAKQQASFDDYRISSPEQRYLNLLETRPDLLNRVPQYQLASYLGITPQSLSRMRARLAKKKS